MKILILHDKSGNIESMVIPQKELEGELTLGPAKGQYVTEVDSNDIEGVNQPKGKRQKVDKTKLAEDILQNYRIKQGKLNRK